MTINDIWNAGKIASVGKWIRMGFCAQCGKKIPDMEDEEVGFEGTRDDWPTYERQYGGCIDADEELEIEKIETDIIYGRVYYDYDPEDAPIRIYLKNKVLEFCSDECMREKEEELFYAEQYFFDGELTYGKDENVNDSNLEKIRKFEEKRVDSNKVYGNSVLKDGTVLSELEEVNGVLSVPDIYNAAGSIFTKTRPKKKEGRLGGTFTRSELLSFAGNVLNNEEYTFRIAAKEGTYSITKKSNFKNLGFKHFVDEIRNEAVKNYNKRVNEIAEKYKSGEISETEKDKEQNKNANTYFVEMHSKLLEGQSKYGYSYALEKRKNE